MHLPKWLRHKRTLIAIPVVLAASACGGGIAHAVDASSTASHDQQTAARQLNTYQINQPTPSAQWSQYRQTLIDTELAQIHGVATTTFGYTSPNSTKPAWSCPSLGFPVASTSQLTNPQQQINNYSNGNISTGVLDQSEPNGTYTGHSSGTYVACVAADGTKYIQYEEGFVHTVGGPAHYDAASQEIVLDGAPTVTTQSAQGTAKGR